VCSAVCALRCRCCCCGGLPADFMSREYTTPTIWDCVQQLPPRLAQLPKLLAGRQGVSRVCHTTQCSALVCATTQLLQGGLRKSSAATASAAPAVALRLLCRFVGWQPTNQPARLFAATSCVVTVGGDRKQQLCPRDWHSCLCFACRGRCCPCCCGLLAHLLVVFATIVKVLLAVYGSCARRGLDVIGSKVSFGVGSCRKRLAVAFAWWRGLCVRHDGSVCGEEGLQAEGASTQCMWPR
jgi:hypothetical protein